MQTARKETKFYTVYDDSGDGDDDDKVKAVYKIPWNTGKESSTSPGKGRENFTKQVSFELYSERRVGVFQLTKVKRESFQAEGIAQEHTGRPMKFRAFREL